MTNAHILSLTIVLLLTACWSNPYINSYNPPQKNSAKTMDKTKKIKEKSEKYVPATNAHRCDIEAADPNDDEIPAGVEGVENHLLWFPEDRIPHCLEAVEKYPNILRYQYNLARLYYKNRNHEEAFKLYKKIADQGYTESMLHLYHAYKNGKGVEKDFFIAKEWKEQYFCRKNYYSPNKKIDCRSFKEEIESLKLQSNNGDASAQRTLGHYYLSGKKGLQKSPSKALFYFKKASINCYSCGVNVYMAYKELNKQGIQKYNTEVGNILYQRAVKYEQGGFSSASDGEYSPFPSQVFVLYKEAAEIGNIKAQYKTAQMYEKGEGTEKSYENALDWYRKAKASGINKANTDIVRLSPIVAKIQRKRAEEQRKRAEEQRKRAEEQRRRQLARDAQNKRAYSSYSMSAASGTRVKKWKCTLQCEGNFFAKGPRTTLDVSAKESWNAKDLAREWGKDNKLCKNSSAEGEFLYTGRVSTTSLAVTCDEVR